MRRSGSNLRHASNSPVESLAFKHASKQASEQAPCRFAGEPCRAGACVSRAARPVIVPPKRPSAEPALFMTLLAPRMDRIQPSMSQAATQRARELRAAGRDIISLSQGEPDFDTPAHVCEAVVQAMARGETRYTGTH